MSRRIDICPTCKGKGEIIVDNWLTEGMTEEEIAREKEKALADIVEVVRCRDCQFAYIDGDTAYCRNTETPWYNDYFEVFAKTSDFCSYGERSE